MSKSIVLVIVCALAVACVLLSASVHGYQMFEGLNALKQTQRRYSSISKLIAQDDNVCCFPSQLTLGNEIIQGSGNFSSYSVKKTQIRAYFDLENKRIREDIDDDGRKTTVFQTQSGGNVVTHIVDGNVCKCSSMISTMERQCIKKSYQPQQVSILGEDALKMTGLNGNRAYSIWLLKDTLKRGTCWPLNMFSTSGSLTIESNFYNMVDTVDPSVFILPPICPPIVFC